MQGKAAKARGTGPPSRPGDQGLSAGAPSDPSRWEAVQRWVVFSDLHVSGATLQTSLEVLRTVRREATARDAGVLFLGDFWHHRGSLPVEPLNAVLQEFRQWTAPTLMLVGNHDQVTAGGLSHALTPIEAASATIHVFDRPTEFLGALWLPYRRGHEELAEAVDSAKGRVGAIFAHVDVVGAYMNETFQARDGLRPELFPPHLPTYTGHYHRRHTVEGTNIHYIGSPYQVSRSETGQDKALTLLDADWKPAGLVPLDVGPKFFLLGGQGVEPGGGEGAAGPRPAVREGDRVRVLLRGEAADGEEEALIQDLRAEGARLEVVAAPAAVQARISAAEEMDAVPLFHRYAEAAGLEGSAVETGLRILQDLETSGARLAQPHLQLRLDSLLIRGFGPFSEEVEYSLQGRGLQVVVGRNADDAGADSNGAGKTALVMAPLWVLTGRLDGGRDGGGGRAATHSDVVSDSSKSAFGRVEGEVNGVPFAVERRVTRRALSKLTFSLDGEDITQADSRMTQAKIDGELGTVLLLRTAFFSQNAVSALLEASDKDFKAELGKVVDLDIWEAARDHAALALKEERSAAEKLSGQAEAASDLCATLSEQLAASQAEADQWEAQRLGRLEHMRGACNNTARELASLASTARLLAARLERAATGVPPREDAGPEGCSVVREEAAEAQAEQAAQAALRETEGRGFALARALEERREAFVQRDAQLRKAEALVARCRAAQDTAETSWREYVGLRGGGGHSHHRPAGGHEEERGPGIVCDRCHQPISREAFARNLARLEAQKSSLAANAAAAEGRAAELAAEVASLRDGIEAGEAEVAEAREAWQSAAGALRKAETGRLQKALEDEREMRDAEVRASAAREASARLAVAAARAEELTGSPPPEDALPAPEGGAEDLECLSRSSHQMVRSLEELSRALAERRQQLSAEGASENPYNMELRRLRSLLQQAQSTLSGHRAAYSERGASMASLEAAAKAFGRTGIPSFLLEGVLTELQAETSRFLKGMSSGFSLTLSPTTERSGRGATASEQIAKAVHVRMPNGDLVERSLRQLSGGERRRLALALGLGFARLAAARGRFECNLLVLDEVLQHLDNDGCEAVAAVLRSLPHGSILLVGQDNTYATEGFDAVDVVVKRGGCSTVESRV